MSEETIALRHLPIPDTSELPLQRYSSRAVYVRATPTHGHRLFSAGQLCDLAIEVPVTHVSLKHLILLVLSSIFYTLSSVVVLFFILAFAVGARLRQARTQGLPTWTG